MRSNRTSYIGERDRYQWIVSPNEIAALTDLVLQHHSELRLCITSFDSGMIEPSKDEAATGWTMHGAAMVSPPLNGSLEIPHDQYDEWYLLDSPSFAARESEVFVNYGGFTVVPPNETYRTFDSTWDQSALDYLLPMQQRFWSQIANVRPVTFIAMGDLDVVVTRNGAFFANLRRAAEQADVSSP